MKIDTATLNKLAHGSDPSSTSRAKGDSKAFGQLLDRVGRNHTERSRKPESTETARRDKTSDQGDDRVEAHDSERSNKSEGKATAESRDVRTQPDKPSAEQQKPTDQDQSNDSPKPKTETNEGGEDQAQVDVGPVEPKVTAQPIANTTTGSTPQASNQAARQPAPQSVATMAAQPVQRQPALQQTDAEADEAEGEGQTTKAADKSRPAPSANSEKPIHPAPVQPAEGDATRSVEASAQAGNRPQTQNATPAQPAPESSGQSTTTASESIVMSSDTAGTSADTQQRDGNASNDDAQRQPARVTPRVDTATNLNSQTTFQPTADPGTTGPVVEVTPSTAATSTTTVSPSASTPTFVPTDASSNADPVVDRAVRGLSSVMAQRGGTVTLRLNPPELGSLRIDVRFVDGSVQARFQASSMAAGTVLQQHMSTLRSALESQGLNVEHLQVHAPNGTTATHAGNAGQQTGQQDAQNAPNDGRSRGFTQDGSNGSSPQDQPTHDQRRRRFEQALLDLVA